MVKIQYIERVNARFLHDTRTSTPGTKEFDALDPDVSQYPKTGPRKRIVARVEVK